MKSNEFQKLIIDKLSTIEGRILDRISDIEQRQKNMEIRQDEIYQVVRSLEHSNL